MSNGRTANVLFRDYGGKTRRDTAETRYDYWVLTDPTSLEEEMMMILITTLLKPLDMTTIFWSDPDRWK